MNRLQRLHDAGVSIWLDTEAAAILRRLEDAGIDLDAITAELEREGVRSFCDSYRQLLDCVESKAAAIHAIS